MLRLPGQRCRRIVGRDDDGAELAVAIDRCGPHLAASPEPAGVAAGLRRLDEHLPELFGRRQDLAVRLVFASSRRARRPRPASRRRPAPPPSAGSPPPRSHPPASASSERDAPKTNPILHTHETSSFLSELDAEGVWRGPRRSAGRTRSAAEGAAGGRTRSVSADPEPPIRRPRLLQPLLHDRARHDAGLLIQQEAAADHGEVGDAADVVLGRDLRMALRVDLQDHGASRHVPRGGLDLGRGHLAGAAPVGPEVDEHGHLRVSRDLAERLRIRFDRPRHRRDRRLAGAAAPLVGQPFGRRPVLLSAGRAGQDHRFAERFEKTDLAAAATRPRTRRRGLISTFLSSSWTSETGRRRKTTNDRERDEEPDREREPDADPRRTGRATAAARPRTAPRRGATTCRADATSHAAGGRPSRAPARSSDAASAAPSGRRAPRAARLPAPAPLRERDPSPPRRRGARRSP